LPVGKNLTEFMQRIDEMLWLNAALIVITIWHKTCIHLCGDHEGRMDLEGA
jgi:hypothetical protein